MTPFPTAIAEGQSAARMEQKLRGRPGSTFYERLFEVGKGGEMLYGILDVLAIPGLSPSYSRKIKQAAQKGAMGVLKMYLEDLKIASAPQTLFLEQIKMGQSLGRVGAFVGFTEGAVKELGNLTHHAFIAENVPIHGVTLDKKEITTHLTTMEAQWDPVEKEWKANNVDQAATFGQLAQMYNAYEKEFNNDDGIRRLSKALNPKYKDMALEKIPVDDEAYNHFGFHKGVARQINIEKGELNLPDLYCLGRFLFTSKGRDQVADYLEKKDPELYKKIYTYTDSKNETQTLAKGKEMTEQWVKITGFTGSEDDIPIKMMYGDREHEQAWMDFALKGSTTLRNAISPDNRAQQYNIGSAFKNRWDYYNRGLGKLANQFMGRYLMDQDRDQPSEIEKSFKSLLELEEKQEQEGKPLSPSDRERYNDAFDRLIKSLDERVDRELNPNEKQWLEGMVKTYVNQLIEDGKIAPNQREEYERHFTSLLDKTAKLIKKRGEKQHLTPEDQVQMMNVLDFRDDRKKRPDLENNDEILWEHEDSGEE